MRIHGLCIFELENNPKILLGCGLYELGRFWGDQIRWIEKPDDNCYFDLEHQNEYFRLMIETALSRGLVIFARKYRKDRYTGYYNVPASLEFKESDLNSSHHWAEQFGVIA